MDRSNRRQQWYFAADHVTKSLWDAGFKTSLIRTAGFEPQFAPFKWWSKSITSAQQTDRLDSMLRANRVFLGTSKVLILSEDVDTPALLMAIHLARKAMAGSFDVACLDLGETRVLGRLKSELAENEPDAVFAHNITVESTWDRIEVARDFLVGDYDALRVMVAVGEPMAVARRLRYDRFSAVFFLAGGGALVSDETPEQSEATSQDSVEKPARVRRVTSRSER